MGGYANFVLVRRPAQVEPSAFRASMTSTAREAAPGAMAWGDGIGVAVSAMDTFDADVLAGWSAALQQPVVDLWLEDGDRIIAMLFLQGQLVDTWSNVPGYHDADQAEDERGQPELWARTFNVDAAALSAVIQAACNDDHDLTMFARAPGFQLPDDDDDDDDDDSFEDDALEDDALEHDALEDDALDDDALDDDSSEDDAFEDDALENLDGKADSDVLPQLAPLRRALAHTFIAARAAVGAMDDDDVDDCDVVVDARVYAQVKLRLSIDDARPVRWACKAIITDRDGLYAGAELLAFTGVAAQKSTVVSTSTEERSRGRWLCAAVLDGSAQDFCDFLFVAHAAGTYRVHVECGDDHADALVKVAPKEP